MRTVAGSSETDDGGMVSVKGGGEGRQEKAAHNYWRKSDRLSVNSDTIDADDNRVKETTQQSNG